MQIKQQLRRSKLSLRELIEKEYPDQLKPVAALLSAVPPTQVSVERLFSALKLLKSDLRSRVEEDLLNAMLFLRANSKNK